MRLAGAALAGLLLLAAPAATDEPSPGSALPEVTPAERDEALRRALRVLAERLPRSFSSYEAQGMFASAVTGLAMSWARDRGDGARIAVPRREVARIAGALARYARKVERFVEGKPPEDEPGGGSGFPSALMRGVGQYDWPLAMAALFFAEAEQRGGAPRGSKAALTSIVKILEAVQQENGGWGHDDGRRGGIGGMPLPIPDPTGRRARLDYPTTLLAATNGVATGLAAARRALEKPGGSALERARAYYAAAQQASGAFPYDPSQKGPEGSERRALPTDALGVVLAAGAVLAHHAMGVSPEDPVGARAWTLVERQLHLVSEGHGSASYGLLLAALASRARGPEAWAAFRRTFFRGLLAAQGEDGTFACACRRASAATTCDTAPLPGGGPPIPGLDADARLFVTAIHAAILALDRTHPRALPPPLPPPAAPPTTPSASD